MSAKIQSLHAKRFKTILDAPIDVAPINVFIGANNAGKSTIVQLLHFCIGIFQAIQLANRWGNQPTVGLSLAPHELLYAPCVDLYSLGYGGKLKEESGTAIELIITLTDGEQSRISVRRGRNGNIRVEVEGRATAQKLANVEQPFTIFSPGLAGIAKYEEFISNGVLLRTIARGDANLVLRNILHRLHLDARKWLDFTLDIAKIFPGLTLDVNYNQATDEHILATAELGHGTIPIELAGTGVLQAVQILSYIHYFSPSTIILDEPDSHLHPNNQRLLCSLLQSIVEDKDTQVFLTTHSRHVVDALSGQARFLWVREGTVVQTTQDHDLAVLIDIGALDAKELVATSHSRCIVLTEDTLKIGLQHILASSALPMTETLILSYHGCTSSRNLRPLLDLIRSSNGSAKIIVHRDRDYLSDDEATAWGNGIRKLHCEPFLTTGTDIESHFLNAELISELNNIAVGDAQQLIDAATLDTMPASIEKYVNGRADIARKSGTFGNLNLGKLAQESTLAVQNNSIRYRHAKTVLKALRERFRADHGRNLTIYATTETLSDKTLASIAKKI